MFSDQFFPFGFTLILVIALLALAVVHKFLRDRNRMRLREMIHQERIAAMQNNQPLPETANGTFERPSRLLGTVPTFAQSIHWARLAALGLGLFTAASGLGMMVAFRRVADTELNRIWAIGFLPLFAGLGLLVFYLITARAGRDEAEAESPESEQR